MLKIMLIMFLIAILFFGIIYYGWFGELPVEKKRQWVGYFQNFKKTFFGNNKHSKHAPPVFRDELTASEKVTL